MRSCKSLRSVFIRLYLEVKEGFSPPTEIGAAAPLPNEIRHEAAKGNLEKHLRCFMEPPQPPAETESDRQYQSRRKPANGNTYPIKAK